MVQEYILIRLSFIVIFGIIQDGSMLILGGYKTQLAQYNKQVYQYDLKTNDIKKYNFHKSPSGRTNFSVTILQNRIFIFGGYNGSFLNDLWYLDLVQLRWQQVQPKQSILPEPRRGHSMIEYKEHLFIFGGIQNITNQKNDIYAYDLKGSKWFKVHSCTNQLYRTQSKLGEATQTQDKRILKRKSTQTHRNYNSSALTTYNISKKKKKQSERSNVPVFRRRYETQISDSSNYRSMIQILKQNKQKMFRIRKQKILKQLQDPKFNIPVKNSPRSQAMYHSISVFGNQNRRIESRSGKTSKRMRFIHSNFKNQDKFLVGKKPCARDGQIGLRFQEYFLIFGGDRHMMPFKDIFYFKLDKSMQDIQL